VKRSILIILLLSLSVKLTAGDNFCGIRNTTFQNGENISFVVFYSALGVYVNAGSASFSANVERFNNKTVYHVKGVGQTNSKYDWIFK
jgi:hypothetical protein